MERSGALWGPEADRPATSTTRGQHPQPDLRSKLAVYDHWHFPPPSSQRTTWLANRDRARRAPPRFAPEANGMTRRLLQSKSGVLARHLPPASSPDAFTVVSLAQILQGSGSRISVCGLCVSTSLPVPSASSHSSPPSLFSVLLHLPPFALLRLASNLLLVVCLLPDITAFLASRTRTRLRLTPHLPGSGSRQTTASRPYNKPTAWT